MSETSFRDALSRLPLLSTLSRQELELIEHRLQRRNLKAGEALFREGEPGTSCSIIVLGEIKVFKSLEEGRVDQLATLPQGALVGHISLIDRKPRSATCRAGATGATVLELSLQDFELLHKGNRVSLAQDLREPAMPQSLEKLYNSLKNRTSQPKNT